MMLGCVDEQIVTDVLKDYSASLLKVKQSKPSSVDITVTILLINIYTIYFEYCL
jgi:hypothetical protein